LGRRAAPFNRRSAVVQWSTVVRFHSSRGREISSSPSSFYPARIRPVTSRLWPRMSTRAMPCIEGARGNARQIRPQHVDDKRGRSGGTSRLFAHRQQRVMFTRPPPAGVRE
jgi:hypothetical protein